MIKEEDLDDERFLLATFGLDLFIELYYLQSSFSI